MLAEVGLGRDDRDWLRTHSRSNWFCFAEQALLRRIIGESHMHILLVIETCVREGAHGVHMNFFSLHSTHRGRLAWRACGWPPVGVIRGVSAGWLRVASR